MQVAVNENLIHFLRQRPDVFALQRDIDLERFLAEAIEAPDSLPVPAKIFLLDELEPHSYGYPLAKAPALDDLEARLEKWLHAEVVARTGNDTATRKKADEALAAYRTHLVKLAQNALHSSILADYHSVFWLVHSLQAAKLFTAFPRRAMNESSLLSRDQADAMKYNLFARWATAMREGIEKRDAFVDLLLDNPFIATEEHISNDLRELRGYFFAHLHRDAAFGRNWIEGLRTRAADLMASDRVFRRAMLLLGYPDRSPGLLGLLDRRVQQLILDHPSTPSQPDQAIFDSLSKRLLEYFIVFHLRRGLIWMKTTADGDNVSEEGESLVYSRAIRPMNFGRRGIVEPIVYRYGLVYDITSFTQTLGEIARGGKEGEQSSYRQMLEFQRDLAEVTRRYGLQFEKFLGDGAFYTSRRATRTIQAAIAIQQFYASMKAKGFAFNKGMRIALNYGYYRLLPMQVSTDGTEIKEFYGPGIVELSRLTTGKATKELEDIQHLLLSHGYDHTEVYKFFAPLARGVDRTDSSVQQREFYAYVNENGHLINEGIVVSIPFLKQLSSELSDDQEKIYRLRAPWANYLGFRTANEGGVYVGVRLLGAVSLKGIGNMEVGEVVRLSHDEAEVGIIDEEKPFVQLLQQERNRTAARSVADSDNDIGLSDLVVCESVRGGGSPEILVGEWDPVSEEVRRPIRLDDQDAERYGLAIPLTAETVESQSVAYQKLYRKLSRLETLPSFSVQAIRDNTNFSGFIIGATVERL